MAKKKSKKHADLPRVGFVIFASWDPAYQCTALLGDGAGTPTGGYGGWQLVTRDRAISLTEWQGKEPLQIDIPILFDGFAEGISMDSTIKVLEKMAGMGIGGNEPPIMTFNSGGVIPWDYHNAHWIDWVISNIQWGDVHRGPGGETLRAVATVTVTQFIDDDILSKLSPAARRRNKGKNKTKAGTERAGAKHKTYVVKKDHESLVTIAKKELGDGSRWHEIAKLNNIRDPKATKKGQVLRLP
jgi:hypothetical protein